MSVLLPHCSTGPELEQSRTVFNRRYNTGQFRVKEKCAEQMQLISFKFSFEIILALDFSLKAMKVLTRSHPLLAFVLNGQPSKHHCLCNIYTLPIFLRVCDIWEYRGLMSTLDRAGVNYALRSNCLFITHIIQQYSVS